MQVPLYHTSLLTPICNTSVFFMRVTSRFFRLNAYNPPITIPYVKLGLVLVMLSFQDIALSICLKVFFNFERKIVLVFMRLSMLYNVKRISSCSKVFISNCFAFGKKSGFLMFKIDILRFKNKHNQQHIINRSI